MSTHEHLDQSSIQPLVDLTNCEREPIHIPGSIQPHGVLLVLQEPALVISQTSNNTEAFLGIAPKDLLDQPLDMLIEDTQSAYLRNSFTLPDLKAINPIKINLRSGYKHTLVDGVIHRNPQGRLILELEPAQSHQHLPFPSFYHVVRTSAETLQGAATLTSLCEGAANEVRKITGFDRVMIYRFDEKWNGEVIAEAVRGDLEPYSGLHYPASDIPAQARELYRRNWLRLIADASYQPAGLLTGSEITKEPLDLSFSVLRSVSPIHLEYLKNMGVAASMSISLIKNGQLWGLISCHHDAPRHVSYEVRAACEFLGQILSLQISSKEDFEDYTYEMYIKDVLAGVLEHLFQHQSPLDGLQQDTAMVLNMTGAQGVALCLESTCVTLGQTPDREIIRQIIAWLQNQTPGEVFETSSLAAWLPEARDWKDTASGVLAISISPLEGSYILWFRAELLQEVRWGGNPEKPVEIHNGIATLHPRQSFAAWSQIVQLQASPWKRCEIEAARTLRSAVVDRVLRSLQLRQAEELAKLNEELADSNRELDSFAYIVSHDLKEPLRGISNFSTIIQHDYASQIDQEGQERISTLIRLSQRMSDLIDSLLHYSRVGRTNMSFTRVDLNQTVARVCELLSTRIEEAQVEIRIPRSLPVYQCDKARIGEVFSNLLSNAIKYNQQDKKWIEIGYLLPEEQEAGETTIFYVRDNGIGIREKNYNAIFQIFKRLHGREAFGGGTGAGLTIVKRIIERHQGRIWVESTYGEGTTFYFTLEKGAHL